MGLITQGGASVGRCALGLNFSSLQDSGSRALDLSVEGFSGINPMTFAAVPFDAGCVALSSQTAAGMLVTRALPAPKITYPKCHHIYAQDHLGALFRRAVVRSEFLEAF
jgi:hypothetical protein